MIPHIREILAPYQDQIHTAADVFAGTTRVGQALRADGITVHSNDVASYSFVFGRAYLDLGETPLPDLSAALEHLNQLPGVDGWYTESYARQSRFFSVENAMRIDAIRAEIDHLYPAPDRDMLPHGARDPLWYYWMTSLIEAADRVDSTCSVQMAYLKSYAARAKKPLVMRPLLIPEGPRGRAYQMDAAAFGRFLSGFQGADLAYLDPPYNNMHYGSNYHLWETLVLDDRPELYGIAQKRVDVKVKKSDWNSKKRCHRALGELIDSVASIPFLLLSFNNEGYLKLPELLDGLSKHGRTHVVEVPVERYIGAKTGIHNFTGERVGTVSHTKAIEYLILSVKA